MNKNPAEITSDAVDRVSRLESGLLQIQEQARVHLDALNRLLQLLQRLPGLRESQIPRNAPSAPEVSILVTPESPETYIPNIRACGLKPAAPNNFDGDRLKGRAFLNSCRLYISLCRDQFRDEQAKIHWALSFMKSRRAALYVNSIL